MLQIKLHYFQRNAVVARAFAGLIIHPVAGDAEGNGTVVRVSNPELTRWLPPFDLDETGLEMCKASMISSPTVIEYVQSHLALRLVLISTVTITGAGNMRF